MFTYIFQLFPPLTLPLPFAPSFWPRSLILNNNFSFIPSRHPYVALSYLKSSPQAKIIRHKFISINLLFKNNSRAYEVNFCFWNP